MPKCSREALNTSRVLMKCVKTLHNPNRVILDNGSRGGGGGGGSNSSSSSSSSGAAAGEVRCRLTYTTTPDIVTPE